MSLMECQQSIFSCIGCQNVYFGSLECSATSSVAAWIRTIFTMESRRIATRDIRLTADLNAMLRTAEPSKAADIAGAFRRFLARFFVYKEYCSNYEVMLRGLVASQRSPPSWPLYETGVEALTRSIRAIDHRRGSNKRAMTVGGHLMSPIQRLTKYPSYLQAFTRVRT